MQPGIFPTPVRALGALDQAPASDFVAREEPLEIQLAAGPLGQRSKRSLAVTMRTPGHDFDLVRGFLYTEGIIQHPRDILSMRYVGALAEPGTQENALLVELAPALSLDWSRHERHFYGASSCGICGKAALEMVRQVCPFLLPPAQPQVRVAVLQGLPAALRTQQPLFDRTGGIHAAALFTASGELVAVREDVGRHNALDKLIGAALKTEALPLHRHLVLVSGRAGFELVQKAVMAGIPLLAAVGAPSSLAVELAQAHGLTLVGFLRHDRGNVYAGAARLQP